MSNTKVENNKPQKEIKIHYKWGLMYIDEEEAPQNGLDIFNNALKSLRKREK